MRIIHESFTHDNKQKANYQRIVELGDAVGSGGWHKLRVAIEADYGYSNQSSGKVEVWSVNGWQKVHHILPLDYVKVWQKCFTAQNAKPALTKLADELLNLAIEIIK